MTGNHSFPEIYFNYKADKSTIRKSRNDLCIKPESSEEI